MIHSNEKLLPGNVVMWHGKPKILNAADIYQNDWTNHLFSPIPLTPEVLGEWCGCTQGDDKEMFRNSIGVWLTKVNGKDEYFIQGFRSGHTIKYLHEYQNSSYFFTGEELVVTIPSSTK